MLGYLHAYESVSEAKQQLATYFNFYNTRRPHSLLGGLTPVLANVFIVGLMLKALLRAPLVEKGYALCASVQE